MSDTHLIPRSVLFGNPDRAMVEISPDGEKLAFLAPLEGVLNVWVAPVHSPEKSQPVTHDTRRGIHHYSWGYTNKHILYLQDADGDENWRVYCVDLASNATVDLTPAEGVQAQLQHVSSRFPEEILVGLNNRNPELHDIYRVDVTTGKRELVYENDGFAGFLTDEEYAIRFAIRFTPEGSLEVFARNGDELELFWEIPAEDAMVTNPVGIAASGDVLYIVDSQGRDTGALIAWDLQSGERKILAADDKADAEAFWIHPKTKDVQAVGFNYERRSWQIVDGAVSADMKKLTEVTDGEMDVVSRSLSDRRWIVAYTLDSGPVRYYLYDRDRKVVEFIFSNRDELEGQPLAKMYPLEIEAQDGLQLVSYLTLPADSDPDKEGHPKEPLPLVLVVHGGPWARDTWGYDPFHQLLANRGYAVLSVNYRGSTGFGKSFVNAANREWAGKMHRDLVDAVHWAVEEQIADPDRIAIMGGSYGGYATLVALTFTPDVFACGVDIVGPSSLITLINNVPPYWAPMLPMLTERVGDPATEEGRKLLDECSPLTRVDNISKPLLIGQGANDPRVKQSEADQIVQAMNKHGIPVTYVLYSDEGHGFARPENRLSFMAIAEAFLSEVLGGSVEPIGNDFQGASLEVPVGAEFVDGLSDTLSSH